MFNKKGVSPLIATVLLIAFAVSLGAVIMNIGVGLSGSVCDDVQIVFFEVGGQPRVCYDDTLNEVRFTIDNRGERIQGIRANAIGNELVDDETFSESIDQLGKFSKTMEISSNNQVLDFSLTPVSSDGTFCPDRQIAIRNIPKCS